MKVNYSSGAKNTARETPVALSEILGTHSIIILARFLKSV
jgi:hypothetical protein